MIGFLGIWDDLHGGPDGSARGALLVTDKHGNPLELEVSTPVRPNRLQVAIWGDRLRPHAVGHLIATPLLNHLKKDPRIVLTNHLDALEAWSATPLVHLRRGSKPPEFDLPQIANVGGRDLHLSVAPTEESQPWLKRAETVLNELDPRFDPLSAFDRIGRALDELAAVDDRYA